MSGNKIFLDTNIILYLLNGDDTLSTFLNNKILYISFVTELELLSFSNIKSKDEKVIKEFIKECKVISINEAIKVQTIKIKRKYKTKLPDSIIAATSLFLEIPLITADTEFEKITDLSLILYKK